MNPKNLCAGIGCVMMQNAHAGDGESSVTRMLDQWRIVHIYRTGERIFAQDQLPAGLYCLQSGHILLWRIDAFGFKTSFRMVSPGELVGYRSLLGDDPHAATAEALSECRICYYPKQKIESLIFGDPDLTRQFFRMLARDRGPPEALLLRGQHLPVRVRLVYLLLTTKDRHAELTQDGQLIYHLPLSRKNIASLIAARPETVTRAIKELGEDGVAVFHNRKVVVPNPAKLYEEARVEM